MRPQYHFAPARNWMNDPNGTYFDGKTYHLFYQYNPESSDWGNICWAYASSKDLVNWTRRGVRLAPDKAAGEQFCFSGCCFAAKDKIKIFYTSIGFEDRAAAEHAKQIVCDAEPDFSHIARKAQITSEIHPFRVREWRDPFVFSFRQNVYLLLAGTRDKRGCILLYRAQDESLNRWDFSGELFAVEGDILECPNAAIFGDTMLLLYSSMRGGRVRYACGVFDGKTLSVREEGDTDFGTNAFYASNLSASADGQTVLYGWLREDLRGRSSPDGLYSGCLALPRLIRLNGYTPLFAPIGALASLEGAALSPESTCEHARIRLATEQNSSFVLRSGGGEGIFANVSDGILHVRRQSKFPDANDAPLALPLGGAKELDILLDGSAIEIFAQGRALSFRFYAAEKEKRLFYGENVHNVRICEMHPARFYDE